MTDYTDLGNGIFKSNISTKEKISLKIKKKALELRDAINKRHNKNIFISIRSLCKGIRPRF